MQKSNFELSKSTLHAKCESVSNLISEIFYLPQRFIAKSATSDCREHLESTKISTSRTVGDGNEFKYFYFIINFKHSKLTMN